MPNQFFSPEGDLENYFVTEYWLIDQYVGDELQTWGVPTSGQLGDATTTGSHSTPSTTFAGQTNWKQVSAGNLHSAAIKTDGTLWMWGAGTNGRLGNGVTTPRTSTPVTTFAGGTNWKQVSCGTDYTTAIKTDGTLWTWGYGNNGRLGNGVTTGNISTPVTTFSGGTNWKQVSAGGAHTAAIKTDGTLWTWGSGTNGRLGNGVITGNISTPVTTFAGGNNWKQVSNGGAHAAAIKTDGTLWTWGRGSTGQLGVNPIAVIGASVTGTISNFSSVFSTSNTSGVTLGDEVISSSPFLNAALGNVTSISTNTSITFSGSYIGAGTYSGTITLGKIARSTPITTFAGGTNWKQVSAGDQHTAAIKTDGTLWTWGLGNNGRLGNGVTTGNISTPVTTFSGGTNWKQVSISTQNTSAIKTDGTLWNWGWGANGVLGNAVTTDRSTPVTTFAGGTNWKQVSPGNTHTLAVFSGTTPDLPIS